MPTDKYHLLYQPPRGLMFLDKAAVLVPGRTMIDTYPWAGFQVQRTVEARCWLEAKHLLGFLLTVDQHRRLAQALRGDRPDDQAGLCARTGKQRFNTPQDAHSRLRHIVAKPNRRKPRSWNRGKAGVHYCSFCKGYHVTASHKGGT